MLVHRHVATAFAHDQLAGESGLLGERRDLVGGVDDVHIRVRDDIAGGQVTLLCHIDLHRVLFVRVQAEHKFLQVQKYLRHILLHPRNGAELLLDALDLDRHDGGPFQRGKQHAPQTVADGMSVAPLERLCQELAISVG